MIVKIWDKIEIIKMPKKHDDLTTYRAFMYDGQTVVQIVEHDWIHNLNSEEEALDYVLWMILNVK
jgi:hypothetical protein